MFKKAERKQVKLRMAITGVAGSGKTLGALLIAKGLGGNIAVLDTENGTASLYSDMIQFDVCNIEPPYTVEKYLAVIEGAEKSGYETIIIDSLSHAWAGEGGILERVEQITEASKSKNSYMAWNKATPLQNKLISKIMNSKINVIATIRSKTAYEITKDGNRNVPVKIGLAPIQREGTDYEFNLVLDISTEGNLATVTKKRGSLFNCGDIFKITEQTGVDIKQWMLEGKEEEKKIRYNLSKIVSELNKMSSKEEIKNLYEKEKDVLKLLNDEENFKKLKEFVGRRICVIEQQQTTSQHETMKKLVTPPLSRDDIEKEACEALRKCQTLEILISTRDFFIEKSKTSIEDVVTVSQCLDNISLEYDIQKKRITGEK